MPFDLPAHCRSRSTQPSGYRADGLTASNPSGNTLAFSQRQGYTTALSGSRNNPSVNAQNIPNRAMVNTKRTSDIPHRISGLPP